jgi:hypothetical protein
MNNNKYVRYRNNNISKEINERWKYLTARQDIYSGSATRSPSLPYSTPRAPNSRVFFTMSTSSLMAEKTLHTNVHTTTSSQLDHNFYTTYSHYSTSHQFFFTHIFFTPIYFTPIFFTPIFFTSIYFLTLLLHN